MAAPFLEFDLARELEQLHSEPEWNSGHNARTLVKYDDLRVVLVALKRYAQLPTHQARGRISIQTVAGTSRCEQKAGTNRGRWMAVRIEPVACDPAEHRRDSPSKMRRLLR
jgi:hypothetical protein